MQQEVIADLEQHAHKIATGEHDKIGPGVPARLSEALQAGEGVAQGDLMLIVADYLPLGYQRVTSPTEQDKQLVPGNTTGSRHCLDSLEGVELYRPLTWTEATLEGPAIVTRRECVVLHPRHGAVTLPANRIIVCYYERELDAVLRQERRALD